MGFVFRNGFSASFLLLLMAVCFLGAPGGAPRLAAPVETRIDGFARQTVRRGVQTVLSATLMTAASVPVQGVNLELEISDGRSWRTIVDDFTATSNVTDASGRATVAFLPPDDMAAGAYAVRAVFKGTTAYAAATSRATLQLEQPRCSDEGVIFNCNAAWEAIRLATHRTSAPGIPLILVHGSTAELEKNRANAFTWGTLKRSLLQSNALAPFDVFVWKHDTARAIGFNGNTGNAADLGEYVNRHLLPKYSPGTKLVFVAHSRGGLVVRSFMNYKDQGSNVLRLIALGSPHHGSPFAVPDWAAITWVTALSDKLSRFDRVYSLGFDVKRLGGLNLAWDNLDGAISGSAVLVDSAEAHPPGGPQLTRGDTNSAADDADVTVGFPASLKAQFGTLAELNRQEKYGTRIVRYGAFDESLADNDELMEAARGSPLSALALTTDTHQALKAAASFLALFHEPLHSSARYFANDGLVPLQSALFLDIADGRAFSSVDNEKHVSLNGVEIVPNCGADGAEPLGRAMYRVWWGARDQIRDHRDLIETTNECYWQAVASDIASALPPTPTTSLRYVLPTASGMTVTTGSSPTAKDYVRLEPAPGGPPPTAFAVCGIRSGGFLSAEEIISAVVPLRRGRLYVENSPSVSTELAIVNPTLRDVVVKFFFTDPNGVDGRNGSIVIRPRSRWTDESLSSAGLFTGTFTFDASAPVAVTGTRTSATSGGLQRITLPVGDLQDLSHSARVIPYFVDGEGWSTVLSLVNPIDAPIEGRVEFFSPGTATQTGQVLTMVVNGKSATTLSYRIPARSVAVLRTAGRLAQSGWIKITPADGPAPASTVRFSKATDAAIEAEFGSIAASDGTSFTLYAENRGPGSVKGTVLSGVAMANASKNPVTVTLELNRLSGLRTGLTSTVVIPAEGQISSYLGQISGLDNIGDAFEGVLKIRSTAPIAVVGLRKHRDGTREFALATTPPMSDDLTETRTDLFIPSFCGGGESRQLVVLSGMASARSGRASFFYSDGRPAALVFD